MREKPTKGDGQGKDGRPRRMRLKVAEQRKKPAAAHTPKGRNPFILDKYGCRIIKRNKTKQNNVRDKTM